jgi:aspartate-semialdehyde dehydrogenase
MDISISTLLSHGLGSQSDPFIDSFEENDITQEEEVIITEVARIIENVENRVVDPTLAT